MKPGRNLKTIAGKTASAGATTGAIRFRKPQLGPTTPYDFNRRPVIHQLLIAILWERQLAIKCEAV
jgi:hypothetical protein